MKLIHEIYETPIEFGENKINVFVIEDTKTYVKLVYELETQMGGNPGAYLLSKDGKALDIDKSIDMISSPFSLDLNGRKVQNVIYKQIEKNINDEFLKEKNELYSQIESFIVDRLDEFPISLTINDDLDIDMILKDLKVKVDESNLNMAERLLDYLKISQEILNFKCTALINVKQYFSNEEMNSFYNEIIYNKYNVLLMETGLDKRRFDQEKTLLIDIDLCEIMY